MTQVNKEQVVERPSAQKTVTNFCKTEDDHAATDPDDNRSSIRTTTPHFGPPAVDTEGTELSVEDDTRQFHNTYAACVSARLDSKLTQATRDRQRNEESL